MFLVSCPSKVHTVDVHCDLGCAFTVRASCHPEKLGAKPPEYKRCRSHIAHLWPGGTTELRCSVAVDVWQRHHEIFGVFVGRRYSSNMRHLYLTPPLRSFSKTGALPRRYPCMPACKIVIIIGRGSINVLASPEKYWCSGYSANTVESCVLHAVHALHYQRNRCTVG